MSRYLWIAVIGVALLGVAGCGGSDSADTTSLATASLTKAQYTKRADEVCRDGYKKVSKLLASVAGSELSDSDRERLVSSEAMKPYKKMVEELRALGAPAGERRKVAMMLAAYEKGINEVEADPSRAISGKLPFDRANNLAKRYGLKICGL